MLRLSSKHAPTSAFDEVVRRKSVRYKTVQHPVVHILGFGIDLDAYLAELGGGGLAICSFPSVPLPVAERVSVQFEIAPEIGGTNIECIVRHSDGIRHGFEFFSQHEYDEFGADIPLRWLEEAHDRAS